MDNLTSKKWQKGDAIYINKLQWDEAEVKKVIAALEHDWFAGNSKYNLEFEKQFASFIGAKHFQAMNSGSAALEIAVQIFVQTGVWKRGDKILHPALTFPTSISAAIRYGLIPVFVDSDPGTYVISGDVINEAFDRHPDIKGAIIPALFGNVPDMDILLGRLNGKKLILDSCDAVGSKWGDIEFTNLADIGCYSFYPSHHISVAGPGGGLATNSTEYFELSKSLTFWGRDHAVDNLDPVQSFLKRYSYQTIGFDAQMGAIPAAFGLAQIERLPGYIGGRKAIFEKLQRLFSKYLDYFILPVRTHDKADPSWFCYPITLKETAPFTREEFVTYLNENKVEIRPLMAGCLVDQLPYRTIEKVTVGKLENTRYADKNGFFLPAWPMDKEQEQTYFDILTAFLEKNK